jgi:hypothetical protein
MNIHLVNREHGFIIVDFLNASFYQMMLFYFIVKDFQNWVRTSSCPKPFLFFKIRSEFFYTFLCFTNPKIRKRIDSLKTKIYSNEDFWRYYYIDVSLQNISYKNIKFKFFKWLISKKFNISIF